MSVDVDFSLALNDRTGKFFWETILFRRPGSRVARVRYGRLHGFPRSDFVRRVAGRLTHNETAFAVSWQVDRRS